MLVTTSYDPAPELELRSKAYAEELRGRWVPRKRSSVSRLQKTYGDQAVLLVAQDGIKYCEADKPPIFFHPSMSAIRIKRLMNGRPDALMQAAQIAPGDDVLDCTAGLASDSIVFSYSVGKHGKVTSLESEGIIAFLIREGLSAYDSGIPELNEAMRRIRVVHSEHIAYMKRQPPRSVDIVYFDPMFRKPVEESSSISPLRELANAEALSREAVEEARRIARKTIVLKEQRNSGEFERLGFDDVILSANKIAYGVIRL
jgi:16S rRNA (guanine1516-N2)-methyltransferase